MVVVDDPRTVSVLYSTVYRSNVVRLEFVNRYRRPHIYYWCSICIHILYTLQCAVHIQYSMFRDLTTNVLYTVLYSIRIYSQCTVVYILYCTVVYCIMDAVCSPY